MACCPESLICLGTRVRAPTRWQPESDWSSALLVDTGPAASLAVVDASVTVSPSQSLVIAGRQSGRCFQQIRETLQRGSVTCGYVLCWRVGGRIVPQNPAGHGDLVNLVRTVIDARRAGMPVHRFEGHIGRISQRSIRLDCPVDDVVEHLCTEVFDGRDFGAGTGAAD